MTAGNGTLDLKSKDEGKYPRLSRCCLCRAWSLDKNLSPIEIPDQVGWVNKKACKKCLDQIFKGEEGDEGSKTV